MSARFIVVGQHSRGTGCLQVMEIDKSQIKVSAEVGSSVHQARIILQVLIHASTTNRKRNHTHLSALLLVHRRLINDMWLQAILEVDCVHGI